MQLNTIASTLRVHPRTVLRALTREKHPYWAAGYNPTVSLAEVAVAFNCPPNALREIHKEQTDLLDQRAAARYLKMPLRTFRSRQYRPRLQFGPKVQRFTPNQLQAIITAEL